jgi:cation diffusion facilitator CzcD-associated flavoprotein CzcO
MCQSSQHQPNITSAGRHLVDLADIQPIRRSYKVSIQYGSRLRRTHDSTTPRIMASKGDSSHELDVLVIGAGFGGCYMLHLLRKKGYKSKVVDAAKTPGGVWAWNRYSGARVDCEFPYYGYSDPEIWNTFEWTERYPDHSQLRRYFEHDADVWDLRRDMVLEITVKSCEYQEGAHGSATSPHWIVKTSTGSEYKCKWLVSATGTSFKQ